MSHSQVVEWISGIVHPVPLAVADVVADLHVLDALGVGQRRGPHAQPTRDRLQPMSSRDATSSVLWNLMVRRM